MQSFSEKNKYYLQKLSTTMNGLDASAKRETYLDFQSESRFRISEYYKTIQEKDVEVKYNFYAEVLENLGEYDFDFVLMNLLLDSDFIGVFNEFQSNAKFNLQLEEVNSSLASFILRFKKRIDQYSSIEKEFLKYLKKEIGIEINSSEDDIWDNNRYNYQEESIVYIYSKHLISRVSSEDSYWEHTVFVHLLFLKAFNISDYFNDQNRITKCILMINQFVKSYNENKSVKNIKLLELQKRINNEIHDNSFVKYNKTPICISVDKANEISKGFGKKIEEYKELLNIRHVISHINNASFHDLYKLSDRVSIQELKKYLNQKIDNGDFITTQDILEIKRESNLNPNMKTAKMLFFQKFYVFEGLS